MTGHKSTSDIGSLVYQVASDGRQERLMLIPQGYSIGQLHNDSRTRQIFALESGIATLSLIESLNDEHPCAECNARWVIDREWAVRIHKGHALPTPEMIA
jgi:hypothetical protein